MKRQSSRLPPPPPERFASIDALRGMALFWLMGGQTLILRLLALSPVAVPGPVFRGLDRSAWAGLTIVDLVFPLLLFLSGCVLPGSLNRHSANSKTLWLRVIRRGVLLVILQMICNGLLQFNAPRVNLIGPLTHLGVCSVVVATLLISSKLRIQVISAAGLLLLHSLITGSIPLSERMTADFTTSGSFEATLSRNLQPLLQGRAALPTVLNYGVCTLLPAAFIMLIGSFAGRLLLAEPRISVRITTLLCSAGGMLYLGQWWSQSLPFIPSLWSGSYVLYGIGCCLAVLLLAHLLVDLPGQGAGSLFFIVIGYNSLLVWLTPFLVNFDWISAFLLGRLARSSGQAADLLLALGSILIQWLILAFLFRQRLRLGV